MKLFKIIFNLSYKFNNKLFHLYFFFEVCLIGIIIVFDLILLTRLSAILPTKLLFSN